LSEIRPGDDSLNVREVSPAALCRREIGLIKAGQGVLSASTRNQTTAKHSPALAKTAGAGRYFRLVVGSCLSVDGECDYTVQGTGSEKPSSINEFDVVNSPKSLAVMRSSDIMDAKYWSGSSGAGRVAGTEC